jgi:site-specific DNA recombinase
LLRGEAASLRMIARSARLSERYVSPIIRFAFLASHLVELIFHGRQPPALTVGNLVQHLPLDWSEQRRIFGLAATKSSAAC